MSSTGPLIAGLCGAPDRSLRASVAPLHAAWVAPLPADLQVSSPAFWSGWPAVASPALDAALHQRVAAVLTALKVRLLAPIGPSAPPADVLCLDLAVVHEDEGWGLRIVELQTFTTVLATVWLLHQAQVRLWPVLGDLKLWGTDDSVDGQARRWRDWVAPFGADGVIAEERLETQPTRHDMKAAQALWGSPVVEPSTLRVKAGHLGHGVGRTWRPVAHVHNRWVPPRPVPGRTDLAWSGPLHSPPCWFHRLDKAVLPDLDLPHPDRCLPLLQWEQLGQPPSELVLKRAFSLGGRDVIIGPSEADLERHAAEDGWLVQPRYRPYPVRHGADGGPLFMELRLVVRLSPQGDGHVVGNFVRCYRGAQAGAGHWTGGDGEGVTVLYNPPRG